MAKREPSYAVDRNENWCICMASMETSMEVPDKTENSNTCMIHQFHACVCNQRKQKQSLKRYMHSNIHSSIIYIAISYYLQQPRYGGNSVHQQMNGLRRCGIHTLTYIHTYNEILLSHKNGEVFPWMGLEVIMHSELHQAKEAKYCI